MRWVHNIRRNSSLLLNIRGWSRLVGNRDIWRQTIQEASAHCRLSHHQRRKLKNNCLLRILKITVVGTEANLTFQRLRLFSNFELQLPVRVNYGMAKIS
jgi:hypothetical protein